MCTKPCARLSKWHGIDRFQPSKVSNLFEEVDSCLHKFINNSKVIITDEEITFLDFLLWKTNMIMVSVS